MFVYVVACYPPASESVIWDTIIQAPESPYSVDSLLEQFSTFFALPSNKVKTRRSAPVNQPSKRKKKGTTGTASQNQQSTSASDVGVLRLRNQRGKYQIGDVTGKLAERGNVTLSVGWNVQPWVGALWWAPSTGSALPHTGGTVQTSRMFEFPALKGSQKSKSGEAVTEPAA